MKQVRRIHGCSLCKRIKAGWDRFASHVGFGNPVRLWHDRWCGDQPLNSELYSLTSGKDASINLFLERRIEGNVKHFYNIQDLV